MEFSIVKAMRLSLMISQSFWKERGLKLMHDLSDGLILYYGSYCFKTEDAIKCLKFVESEKKCLK